MRLYVAEPCWAGSLVAASDLGIKSRTPFTWLRVERALRCPSTVSAGHEAPLDGAFQRPGDRRFADREMVCAARRPNAGAWAAGGLCLVTSSAAPSRHLG